MLARGLEKLSEKLRASLSQQSRTEAHIQVTQRMFHVIGACDEGLALFRLRLDMSLDIISILSVTPVRRAWHFVVPQSQKPHN